MIPTSDQIHELERRLRQAMRASAVDELDALLAEDLVFTDHLGGVWGKQEDLAAHRSAAIHIDSLSVSDEHVVMLDGVAVVNMLLELSGTFAGQAASGSFRFTRVWAPTGAGRWQVVAAHSTRVAEGGRREGEDHAGGSIEK